MFDFVKGLTNAAAKTVIGLPVAAIADVITLGGVLTDKRGDRPYIGDMLKSIGESVDEMTE